MSGVAGRTRQPAARGSSLTYGELTSCDALCELLPRHGLPAFFDAGCGAGRVLAAAATAHPGATVAGAEIVGARAAIADAALRDRGHVHHGDAVPEIARLGIPGTALFMNDVAFEPALREACLAAAAANPARH